MSWHEYLPAVAVVGFVLLVLILIVRAIIKMIDKNDDDDILNGGWH